MRSVEADSVTIYPALIKPGMTGSYAGKRFTVIRHAETGEEVAPGQIINNDCRNKFWVHLGDDAKPTLFCVPPSMTYKEWLEFFDFLPNNENHRYAH